MIIIIIQLFNNIIIIIIIIIIIHYSITPHLCYCYVFILSYLIT